MTSKMLLFAFFVQSWCYDMLELMIIIAAYEVSAYWSSRIYVFCFPVFSLSYFQQTQTPIHSRSPSLLCFQQHVVEASIVSHCSGPFYSHSDNEGPWSDPDDLRLTSGEYSCTRWHSGLFWSQIKDGPEVEWHVSTFLIKLSYSSHWNLLIWFPCVFFNAFPCLYTMPVT